MTTVMEKIDTPTTGVKIMRDTVAVLIPAHNEAAQIESTLRSLIAQTLRPQWIIVICDNCDDETFAIASIFESNGVVVIETNGNTFKKAGALNTGVRYLLGLKIFPEYVVTIDADTILESHFIERSTMIMANRPDLGGISAVCRGKSGLVKWPTWQTASARAEERAVAGQNLNADDDSRKPGFPSKAAIYARMLTEATGSSILVWLERAEYERAGATRIRTNIHTLSGAGSLMRAEAIFDVLNDRGELYAERLGNMVEDFEATLQMKVHGWKCTNNYHCVAYTDLMLTLPALMAQRRRWVVGSLNELRRRGWKKETKASILALIYGYASIPLFYWWLWMFVTDVIRGDLHVQTAYILLIVCSYQGWTLRGMSWKSKLIGFVLFPEQVFNLVRHSWLISSLVTSLLPQRTHNWE